jgi:very-short-patch-repair endonuclease
MTLPPTPSPGGMGLNLNHNLNYQFMAYLGKSVEKEMYFGAKPKLFEFARAMRKNPTDAERILWTELKKLRSNGIIFRRQHPIDLFIADFYCHSLKIIIEVDGEIHESTEERDYDLGRTAELDKHNITVLRFNNEEVLSSTDSVIKRIKQYIYKNSSPSILGEGSR